MMLKVYLRASSKKNDLVRIEASTNEFMFVKWGRPRFKSWDQVYLIVD